ncbi:barstar family protein [Deinococcus sp. QL22]|uniref:barstar family protein n=1 Tax=Deinococcus sp. QL22 TaxID=2939437 RepID=UPI0020175957|nr:barstar family protein [Deinococcus sp. QL22]UQN05737.1 barstar family protein [Deinococcus sp. QL22]
MAEVELETSRIFDWDTFHDVCSEVFGFPEFYGRNMNAWIDCLTYLDDGMTKFTLGAGELLLIRVTEFKTFSASYPELASTFLECVAFVNRRALDCGEPPQLALVLC